MSANHLRALISELHPGVAVRRLTLAAGLDANKIAYYLKPSTEVDQIPKVAVLEAIAAALGCDLALVVQAFAADVGLPWGLPVEDAELGELLRNYLRMSEADRANLMRVADWAAAAAASRPLPRRRRGQAAGAASATVSALAG